MLAFWSLRSFAITSSPISNVFLTFYKYSKERDQNAHDSLHIICGKLKSETVHPGNMEFFLKGLNNYSNHSSETPEVWESIKNNFNRNRQTYNPRITALLLEVIWRKRFNDVLFIETVYSTIKHKIHFLDNMSVTWLCEFICRYKHLISIAEVQLIEEVILKHKDHFTAYQVKGVCKSLKYIYMNIPINMKVYECLSKLVVKFHEEFSLFDLGKILNAMAFIDGLCEFSLFTKLQNHIVSEIKRGKFRPSTLAIILNAYCQVYPSENFEPFFSFCEEVILKNPEVYLSDPMQYCTFVHCFAKVKAGNEIYKKLQKYAFVMYKEKDMKRLGVTLANLMKSKMDSEFLDETIKPLFLDVVKNLSDIHLKKCLLFLLQRCPDDTEFWNKVRIRVQPQISATDAIHFKPVATVLKERLGIELSEAEPAS